MIGRTLSHYEITAKLGEGGMGEVWRAEDTKLGRQVAIKVLPEVLAADGERVARLEREARVLAHLNHPNIATLFGLEDVGSSKALVMELVEGPTLQEDLASRRLPLEESLEIARQIAEALEEAHGKGVVHRDLKPGNVVVSENGQVKVLDFGLAKAFEPDVAGQRNEASRSPTLSYQATRAGVILGTAAYMSPEQARGKPVDRRADIWSFGCVVYEMLTGRHPFEGDDFADTLANVVKDEPDWSILPALPEPLGMFLKQCFRKDPGQRLGDIRELRLALEGAFESPAPAAAAVTLRGRWWERAVWMVLLLGSLALAATLAVSMLSPPAPSPLLLSLVPENPASVDSGFAVSPDGRSIVYSGEAEEGGARRLWLRHFDEAESRELPGTEGGSHPFWSPDGSSIGFLVGSSLKRLPVMAGGPARTICDFRSWSSSWGAGDVILLTGPRGIYSCPAGGGERASFLLGPDAARDERQLVSPAFLPDGRRFLYAARGQGSSAILLASLDSAVPPRRIIELADEETRVEYVDPGFVFYLEPSRILVARPVDPETVEPIGPPIPVASEALSLPGGWASFSVSGGGTLVFQTAEQSGTQTRLLWMDRQGRVLDQLGTPGGIWTVAISPDQKSVAANLGLDIVLYDLNTGIPTRATSSPSVDCCPVWSPDGERFAFLSRRNGAAQVFVKRVATGEETRLEAIPDESVVTDWSPDGDLLVLASSGPKSSDLWIYSFAEDSIRQFIEAQFDQQQARLSPNGDWLAYTSTSERGDGRDVFITSFPRPGLPLRISPSGGEHPRWRGDGRELFYVAPGGSIRSVAVSGGSELVAGRSTLMFDAALYSDFWAGSWFDVSRDGERFLVIERIEGAGPSARLSVLSNWLSKIGGTRLDR